VRPTEGGSDIDGAAPRREPLAPLNPAWPELRSEPYRFYRTYRARDPVHRGLGPDPKGPGCWYLMRYADAVAALTHPALVQTPVLPPDRLPASLSHFRPLLETWHRWMVTRNPPDHTRLRRALGQALTLSVPEVLEQEIEDVANGLLDRAEQAGTIDLIGDYAAPLAVLTISRILGSPSRDWRLLRQWSASFATAMDLQPGADALEGAARAARDSSAYLRELLAERRRNPGSDMISLLVSARGGPTLSEDELISNCMLLLFAGHETTVNLIGNGVLALWRDEASLRELRRSPDSTSEAVEELLRFDSPTQMVFRLASRELGLGGRVVGKDELVGVVLGAANRDPARFKEPDRLDLSRGDTQHLSFGRGIHSCMGAALARSEGKVAIRTLLRRVPDFEIQATALEWRTDNVTLRGLKRLPLTLMA
jgi:pimeloyl-[acyl-carrier protein] synthase